MIKNLDPNGDDDMEIPFVKITIPEDPCKPLSEVHHGGLFGAAFNLASNLVDGIPDDACHLVFPIVKDIKLPLPDWLTIEIYPPQESLPENPDDEENSTTSPSRTSSLSSQSSTSASTSSLSFTFSCSASAVPYCPPVQSAPKVIALYARPQLRAPPKRLLYLPLLRKFQQEQQLELTEIFASAPTSPDYSFYLSMGSSLSAAQSTGSQQAFNSSSSSPGILSTATESILTVPSSSIPRTIISTSDTSNSKSTGYLIGNVTFLSETLSGTKSRLFTSHYSSASSILFRTTITSKAKVIPNAFVTIESTSVSNTAEATISWVPSISISTSKPSSSIASSPRTTSSAAPARSSTITVPSSHVASTTTPAIEATTLINMFQMNFWHQTDKKKKSTENLWYMYVKKLVDINLSHLDFCQTSGLVSVQDQNITSHDLLPNPIPYPEGSFALPPKSAGAGRHYKGDRSAVGDVFCPCKPTVSCWGNVGGAPVVVCDGNTSIYPMVLCCLEN
ncbi:hypothetical protein BPAE_0079g00160 [Botrytis paeoniae]|uniref:Uncharacterized protein n=1 Tax=Botrytis paeoniae TaxID=278948 RepID=A0A4Z1FQ16_9HELO|nr:hypothetical protein BPAE_0079g00160 [Botrytis paeoniae]